MKQERIFLKNINEEWSEWCKKVGSENDFNIGSIVWRYIQEGKDPMTIPLPPVGGGLVGREYHPSIKYSWKEELTEMIEVYHLVNPILEDPDHLARIRRRLEDRLRTGANSGLGEMIIMLAQELDINLE